ncbi:MAG: RidA family protein [Saprospiraceae bacterium]|nr:RidA family protein [Saprospiraceae bacterium]
MENRQNIASGTSWEAIVGYSRGVRIGSYIEISGTTAVDGATFVGEGDVYIQTKFILQKIEKAVIQLGASLQNVIRTRMYVTDISQWEAIAKAHSEVFDKIRPATSMVQVSKLIDDRMLIEIEATAIL